MSDTLYEYYRQQEVLPTYGGFRSPEELSAHERQRRRLFTDKLYLPARLFENARVLEFGPDAGENSLVFARWGAHCTLAEPNLKAHPVIREYFRRFDLGARLAALESADVVSFPEPESAQNRYDLIDAEGFVYTVKPETLWIGKFARLLREEGFVVLFYCEACGGFVELLLKVVQARMRQWTGLGPLESARRLFQAKWNSIPHKRKMESWVMDVLENPFVRLRYFLEPKTFCGQMAEAGFSLYSAWPPYGDGLAVHWFKKTLSPEEQLRSQQDFIMRSRLSHLFGRKHFLVRLLPDLEETLRNLLALADGLIDQFDKDRAAECGGTLGRLEAVLTSPDVLAEPADTAASLQTVACFRRLLDLLMAGSPADLEKFCNTEAAFVQAWGMPSHFAVFRKGTA